MAHVTMQQEGHHFDRAVDIRKHTTVTEIGSRRRSTTSLASHLRPLIPPETSAVITIERPMSNDP